VLTLLLYQIFFRHGRKRRRQKHSAVDDVRMSWPGLDSEFYQLEKQLSERGVMRQSSEPLSDWLARALADPALRDLQVPLQELLRLHYRHRFDPRGLDAVERQRLERNAKDCLDRLARMQHGAN
jgi:hypothetical protein